MVTGDGAEYYVGVADAGKAGTFYAGANHNLHEGAFKQGTQIQEDFQDAIDGFYSSGTMSVDQAQAAAPAYILKKYDTGMVLYKKHSNGNFKPISSKKTMNISGPDTYSTGGC